MEKCVYMKRYPFIKLKYMLFFILQRTHQAVILRNSREEKRPGIQRRAPIIEVRLFLIGYLFSIFLF